MCAYVQHFRLNAGNASAGLCQLHPNTCGLTLSVAHDRSALKSFFSVQFLRVGLRPQISIKGG